MPRCFFSRPIYNFEINSLHFFPHAKKNGFKSAKSPTIRIMKVFLLKTGQNGKIKAKKPTPWSLMPNHWKSWKNQLLKLSANERTAEWSEFVLFSLSHSKSQSTAIFMCQLFVSLCWALSLAFAVHIAPEWETCANEVSWADDNNNRPARLFLLFARFQNAHSNGQFFFLLSSPNRMINLFDL